MTLLSLTLPAVTVLASGDSGWLLLSGPATGAFTYWAVYRYYRNHDKSHEFETDTLIDAQPIEGSDVRIDHIRKTRESRVEGENGNQHRVRVARRIP